MKLAVIYARYSSDRQTEQSIDGQLRVCREYAQRNDIIIIDTYIDRAMTGTNDNRDDFQRMLKDSDKKAFDYVLVYKLDRFSRNKYEMAMHRKRLKDNGVKILSAMENIPETPEGILLESLLEGMNQYYSEELSQKSRRGLNETRIKGNFPGGRPNYGYRVINKKVVVCEDEANIIRRFYDDYAAGKSMDTMMKEYIEQGILDKGKPFARTQVYSILQNAKYIGHYEIHGKTYDHIFPAIISKDVFDIVRKRITANKYGKHTVGIEYLLKGRIFCGDCNLPLYSYTGTSADGTIYRYYKCHSVKSKTNCKCKPIKKEFLENTVLDCLDRTLTEKGKRKELISAVMEKHKRILDDNCSLRSLEKEYQRINKSLTNLLNAIEDGIYTSTTKRRLEELENAKRELEEKLLIERAKEKSVLTETDVENYLTYALKKKGKILIDLLVKKVLVFNDKIQIQLQFSADDTPDDKTKSPDGTLSEQGILFSSYTTERVLPQIGRRALKVRKCDIQAVLVEIYL